MNKLLKISLAAILLTSLCHARAPVDFSNDDNDDSNVILEEIAEIKESLGDDWEVEPAEPGSVDDNEEFEEYGEKEDYVDNNEELIKWSTSWDATFKQVCPKSYQAIIRIQSYHDNHREDRRFKFSCGRASLHSLHRATCQWTGYQNKFDKPIDFRCPSNQYIGGINSYHSNHHEDRKWGFYCCKLAHLQLGHCYKTAYTNDWDAPQDFTVPRGYVLTGTHSIHSNYRE